MGSNPTSSAKKQHRFAMLFFYPSRRLGISSAAGDILSRRGVDKTYLLFQEGSANVFACHGRTSKINFELSLTIAKRYSHLLFLCYNGLIEQKTTTKG